jgi:arginine/ornithine N-succinyltransferase beta subunit
MKLRPKDIRRLEKLASQPGGSITDLAAKPETLEDKIKKGDPKGPRKRWPKSGRTRVIIGKREAD